MVAWLSHAGTLIRAAPEHLRMATSLGTRTYDMLTDTGFIRQNSMAGSRDVDLGAVPTAAEERSAQHMHMDEPPPLRMSPVGHDLPRPQLPEVHLRNLRWQG